MDISVTLTTTRYAIGYTIVTKEVGLCEQLEIMVSGAPVDAKFVRRIGADGCGPNAKLSEQFTGAVKELTMLSENRLPVVIIACQVLEDMLNCLLPANGISTGQITYMDYGLHSVPSRMAGTLQDHLDKIEDTSLIVLGYGLCGNGLKGIKAGKHILLVPRTDDCIALLLGSYQAYRQEFSTVPGTYYLSKGWLESGSHPLSEYEEYVPKYGQEKAMWIMDQQYQNYERLMLVTHTPADMEKYRPVAQQVGRFCERWEMSYEERIGSDAYVRRLIEVAMMLSQGQELPDGVDRDFVVITPGNEIRQDQFIRHS